uniref:SHSP domain-containing protein n=1 Tax=Kalanchoe fedtschenkoi TaxID=63787 RepID=A0A7N1A5B8_KALFE
MAQSISAVNVTLPLSSDRSSFISKSIPSTFSRSFKPKATSSSSNGIVSMAGGGDLDHLQRPPRPQQPQQPKGRVEAAPVAVGLWDRFPTARTMQQMMETMERMIEDPQAYTTPTTPPTQNGSYGRGRAPWEIKEGESEYKLRFDMPGMTREDVKVWVEEKMLVVQAEKAPRKKQSATSAVNGTSAANSNNGNGVVVEEEEEEEEWPAKSYGRYRSRIALPENIQFEKIKAEVRDGVLYITIPKATVSAKVLDIAVQ